MDRRRRIGCWVIAGSSVLSLVLLWWFLPVFVCLAINTSLPRELGSNATFLSVHADCSGMPQPEIFLEATPSRLHRIATGITGRWIPPGVIRAGLGAVGSLRGDAGIALGWQLTAVSDVDPPRLSVSMTPAQVDALLISGGSTSTVAGFHVAPHIASAELSEISLDGGPRRFRLEAAGSLRLVSGAITLDVPVRRLSAVLTVTLTPAATGWEPNVSVAVDVLDAALPSLMGMETHSWSQLLAAKAESRINDRLSDKTLPAWFPIDLQLSAVVR
ncbi:MAG: hypothetical protein AAB263_18920 [Planctomycetota bacterium]